MMSVPPYWGLVEAAVVVGAVVVFEAVVVATEVVVGAVVVAPGPHEARTMSANVRTLRTTNRAFFPKSTS